MRNLEPAKKIELYDLPKFSIWPARLLGLTPWSIPVRNVEKVDREYDREKYGNALALLQERGADQITPDEILLQTQGQDADAELCVSQGNNLFLMELRQARSFFHSVLAETLASAIAEVSTVIELGCGIGANLWRLSRRFPGKTYLGVDYSRNAVLCAEYLFGKNNPDIEVAQFNFYDSRYDVLEKLGNDQRVLLFTCHALEQIPAAAKIVETLAQYKKKIHVIYHFEPVYELYDNLLQGLMRRRYTEINDYNRDLLSVLKGRPDVRIRHTEANVFGVNPLNPTSIILWEFMETPASAA